MKKNLFLLLLAVPFIFQSCGDDGISHKAPAELTLYHGETFELKASSDHPITYSSENQFIAHVTQQGVIEGGTIGETTIIMDNKKVQETIKVTVPAKYNNVFPEPTMDWTIKKEGLFALLGEPAMEYEQGDYEYYYYFGKTSNGCNIQYAYLFQKQFGLFQGVNVAIIDPTSSVKNIEEFVAERYRLYLENELENGYSIRYYCDAYEYSKRTMSVRTIDYRDYPDARYFLIGYSR